MPGDTTGQSVNDVWFVVPPYSVRIGSSDELGDFLVDANGMTLYMFTNDETNVSNCYDQCAVNWPPLLVQAGEVPVPGFGVSGELGMTLRDDETLQVTYNGMPLYYWVNDAAPGDTTGQGVNDLVITHFFRNVHSNYDLAMRSALVENSASAAASTSIPRPGPLETVIVLSALRENRSWVMSRA